MSSVPASSSAALLKLRANSTTSTRLSERLGCTRWAKLPRASSCIAVVIARKGRTSVTLMAAETTAASTTLMMKMTVRPEAGCVKKSLGKTPVCTSTRHTAATTRHVTKIATARISASAKPRPTVRARGGRGSSGAVRLTDAGVSGAAVSLAVGCAEVMAGGLLGMCWRVGCAVGVRDTRRGGCPCRERRYSAGPTTAR